MKSALGPSKNAEKCSLCGNDFSKTIRKFPRLEFAIRGMLCLVGYVCMQLICLAFFSPLLMIMVTRLDPLSSRGTSFLLLSTWGYLLFFLYLVKTHLIIVQKLSPAVKSIDCMECGKKYYLHENEAQLLVTVKEEKS